MNRTFRGFLKQYCAELAEMKTSSYKKLVSCATSDSPRVAEPLFLLALEEGRLDYLLRLSEGAWMQPQYEDLSLLAGKYESAELFLKSDDAPKRYKSVLDAYKLPEDRLRADRRVVDAMRKQIVDCLSAAGVSRYRLCRDLGLNEGNAYAYLAGDSAKVSRATARKMLEYAQAL